MQGLSTSLVLIAVLAVVAPIATRLLDRWVKVPIVVFEIVLGILFGPSSWDGCNPPPSRILWLTSGWPCCFS